MHTAITLQFSDPKARSLWPRKAILAWVKHALSFQPETCLHHLTLRFVGAKEMQALNRDYRHKDYPTNVLTFCYPAAIGEADIVICSAVVQKEARDAQRPFSHHAIHILVHGVLHALGHDHIKHREAQVMEALEACILGAIAPSSL